MKLTEIQDLIKFVSRSGVTEVEIEQSNFKITIKSDPNKKRGKAGAQQAEAYVQPQMPMAMPQMMPAPHPQQMAQPQPQAAPAPSEEKKEEKKEDNSNYITVKSPMIGTFYRSSSPDKDAFISVGDDVKKGKVVCIIEAMKLFNEIEAEVEGKVVKVLVDDATPVEYDQPLFLIDPS
ncbi:MAG TPA: acetyl-CoA carboxylase biotin carboxyl carrier protein [Cryomorphaceae bacterium]|nr:acetyl-CoA carboxylase biotin carboxyl carrier protein [Cryomorphaceae bacterium]